MTQLAVVILAAGKGKRMNSDLPKVLLKVRDKTMLEYNLDLAHEVNADRIITVVGYQKEKVIEVIQKYKKVEFIDQVQLLGTGHAVNVTKDLLKDFSGDVIILYGDVPLLSSETLITLKNFHKEEGNAVTVITAEIDDPFGYGRIIRDAEGRFTKIVEEKDANESEKAVREINSGIMIFDSSILFPTLSQIRNENSQAEYYLTDAIEILNASGQRVGAFKVKDPREVLGANTPEQLAQLETAIAASENL